MTEPLQFSSTSSSSGTTSNNKSNGELGKLQLISPTGSSSKVPESYIGISDSAPETALDNISEIQSNSQVIDNLLNLVDKKKSKGSDSNLKHENSIVEESKDEFESSNQVENKKIQQIVSLQPKGVEGLKEIFSNHSIIIFADHHGWGGCVNTICFALDNLYDGLNIENPFHISIENTAPKTNDGKIPMPNFNSELGIDCRETTLRKLSKYNKKMDFSHFCNDLHTNIKQEMRQIINKASTEKTKAVFVLGFLHVICTQYLLNALNKEQSINKTNYGESLKKYGFTKNPGSYSLLPWLQKEFGAENIAVVITTRGQDYSGDLYETQYKEYLKQYSETLSQQKAYSLTEDSSQLLDNKYQWPKLVFPSQPGKFVDVYTHDKQNNIYQVCNNFSF